MLLKVPQSWLQRSTSHPLSGPQHPFVEAMLAKARQDYDAKLSRVQGVERDRPKDFATHHQTRGAWVTSSGTIHAWNSRFMGGHHHHVLSEARIIPRGHEDDPPTEINSSAVRKHTLVRMTRSPSSDAVYAEVPHEMPQAQRAVVGSVAAHAEREGSFNWECAHHQDASGHDRTSMDQHLASIKKAFFDDLTKARRDYTLPQDLESQVWDAGPEKFAKPGHERCREMAGTQSRGVVYQSTGDRHTATGPISEQAPTLCTCVRTWVKKNGLRPRNIKKSLAGPPCTVPNCPQCALRAQGGGGLCGTCEHPKWTHNDKEDNSTSWAPSRGWCGHGYKGCAWDKDDQEPRHQFKPMDVGETLPSDIRDLKLSMAGHPRESFDSMTVAERERHLIEQHSFAKLAARKAVLGERAGAEEHSREHDALDRLKKSRVYAHAAKFAAERRGLDYSAIRRQHRATWTQKGGGYDVTCKCGFETRTGGAIKERVKEDHDKHVFDEILRLGDVEKSQATTRPTLVLVRHPETKLNREGKTRGWSNPPIDEEGMRDARKATAEIAREFQVGHVVASDLDRAAVFAKMIGKATGAPVIVSGRLRPWNLGEMTGKPSKATMPEMLRYVATPDKAIPGGGESWNDFLERNLSAMRVLLNETRDEQKATVVVTHTRNIRSLLGWLEGGEAGIRKYVAEEKDPVEPADFVAIRFDGKNWTPEKDVEGARDPGRLAKAGPPSQKNQDKAKDGDNAQKEGVQPKASLQDIKPGPSKIDHTTVPHGKKVWVAIKTGPLAGRPVVLRRKESGHFTIAQSKDAPNAVGRRPIAEPSAAHKTLYPEATGDEAETQASIGLSHGNVQGTAPGKTIDESLPNARQDMNDAGVEPWHRTPSVGEGYYAEPGFPTTPENDIDLHMAGSRRSVRWVTAKMASEGGQHQAFIFHHSKTGATPMTRIQLGSKVNPQNFSKAMAVVAEQLPKQGWHVAYDSEGKPREVVIAGIGKQKNEHRAQIKRVRAALEKHRLKLGKNYHHQVDVESLCDDKPDSSGHCATHGGQTYDAVLKRGHGFKGWYDGPSLRGRGRGAVDGGGGAGSGGGDRGGLQSPADRGGTAGGRAEHPGRTGRGGLGRDEPGHHSTEPPIDIGDEWRAEDKEGTEALVKQAVRRAKRNKNLANYDYTDDDRRAIMAMAADPEHIKELVRTYKSLSDDQRAAGHGWYHVTRAKIKHMAKTHGVPYKIAAAAVAAMSPRTGWANNLKGASALMERHVKGLAMPTRCEEIGYGGYTANMIKAWRILKGESPDVVLDETAERTSGDKVRNFYRNFMNDQHSVTVDTWAQKGADKDREYRPIGKTSQYQPYQNAYKRAALRLGITPEALQAAVWLKVRKDEEEKPGARNPWSRQEEGGYVPEGAYMKSQAIFDPSSVIMRKSESRDEESDISAEREQLRLRLLRLPPVGVAHDAVVQMISDLDDLVA